jgi:hypothetical protein
VFTMSGFFAERAPDVVTVILIDLGDGRTQMDFRQRGSRTAEEYERGRKRWSAEFDLIAERLREG